MFDHLRFTRTKLDEEDVIALRREGLVPVAVADRLRIGIGIGRVREILITTGLEPHGFVSWEPAGPRALHALRTMKRSSTISISETKRRCGRLTSLLRLNVCRFDKASHDSFFNGVLALLAGFSVLRNFNAGCLPR